MAQQISRIQMQENERKKKKYILLVTLLFALIISNFPNYLDIFWRGSGGIEARYIINFIIFPLIVVFLSKDIFENIPDDKVIIKNHYLNHGLIAILIFVATTACILGMKQEQNEAECIKESIVGFADQKFFDLNNCLEKANDNWSNLKSVFSN